MKPYQLIPLFALVTTLMSCTQPRSGDQIPVSGLTPPAPAQTTELPAVPANSSGFEPTNPDDFFIISGSLQFVEFYSDT